MRRLLPVLAAITIIVLSGCTIPGLPGSSNIGSDWPAMPNAEQFIPETGVCHEYPATDSGPFSYVPIPCTRAHMAETIYLGTLTGAVAQLKASPRASDDESAPIWSACGKEVSNVFGRSWLDYRLRVYTYWPSLAGWAAGSRWVRCDVVVPRDMARVEGGTVSQDKPFSKSGLESLALGCFELNETAQDDSLVTSPCDVPHNTEYAGSVSMPKTTKYPSTDEEWNVLYDHCFGVIAEFVGVRVADLEAGAYAVPEDSTWMDDESQKAVRCYLWLDDRKMATSAKGTRGVGIP